MHVFMNINYSDQYFVKLFIEGVEEYTIVVQS